MLETAKEVYCQAHLHMCITLSLFLPPPPHTQKLNRHCLNLLYSCSEIYVKEGVKAIQKTIKQYKMLRPI